MWCTHRVVWRTLKSDVLHTQMPVTESGRWLNAGNEVQVRAGKPLLDAGCTAGLGSRV